MWENILGLAIGILFIYISYQIYIKSNFKHTHIDNEWIKNLPYEELTKLKKGFAVSYLIIGIMVIIGTIISNLIFMIPILILIVLNLFRIALKYIYFRK